MAPDASECRCVDSPLRVRLYGDSLTAKSVTGLAALSVKPQAALPVVYLVDDFENDRVHTFVQGQFFHLVTVFFDRPGFGEFEDFLRDRRATDSDVERR